MSLSVVSGACAGSLPPDRHVDDDEEQQSEGGHPTADDQRDGRELRFIHVLEEKYHTGRRGEYSGLVVVCYSHKRYSALNPTGARVCKKTHMHTGARGYQTRLLSSVLSMESKVT